ncbi:hypothetical protein [Bacillus xiapuensis]|uniref:Uncharacterized protein n=1 Tax=Bacillus xiapuensis TaxID=2014075 RepID=A0ABU6N8G7_9BACI|nr:hypothetical protein [Bacillus xiapuensis]
MKLEWWTLAKTNYGTIKMRFKEKLTRNEAVEIGSKYCEEKGMEYVGTYSTATIDEVEQKVINE